MIFPNLECEAIVQVNDKTRLNGSKSFITPDESAITLVEIEPESGNGYINVTGAAPLDPLNWYLDWQYATNGTKTATIRVTTSGAPVTVTKTISVLSVVDDKLFSDDSDLIMHESEILRWVPVGRNSFKDMHRRAQQRILAWLDEKGHTDSSGARLTKASIVDVQEVKEWSIFLTLRMIFQSISNAVDDVFDKKAKYYESREAEARNRSALRYDYDGDGAISGDVEGVRISASRLIRT